MGCLQPAEPCVIECLPAGGAVVLAGEGLAGVDGVLGVAVVGLDVDVLPAVVGVAGLGAAGEERAAGAEPTDLYIADVTKEN